MEYKNRLLLIDGYALLYRSHYAFIRNPLITRSGINTSAAFGFMRTLLDCVEQFNPTHIGVAFDLGGKTFRHEMYPDYKANREATPQEIKDCREAVREYLKVLNIVELWAEGFEADDVIGSISAHLASEQTQVLIYTPDKDFQQLLGPNVILLRPKSTNGIEIKTEADLLAQYNIKSPLQFIDILALWGDTADNVPGVDGIGEKTAASLIAKYGSIEHIYGNSSKLTKKMAENLQRCTPQLKRAQELVRIRLDAPIPTSLAQYLMPSAPAYDELQALNQKYEFHALGERIVNFFCKTTEPANRITLDAFRHKFKVVSTYETLTSLATELKTPTTSYALCLGIDNSEQLNALALSYYQGNEQITQYIDLAQIKQQHEDWQKLLNDFLALPSLQCYGYDLKAMLKNLKGLKLHLEAQLSDVLLAHYLLAPEALHTLDALCNLELQYTLHEELTPEAFAALPSEERKDYLCERAAMIYKLGERFEKRLENEGLASVFTTLEMPLLRVLTAMEEAGVAINKEELVALHNELEAEQNATEKEIRELGGVDDLKVSSPKQIGILLFEKLKIAEKAKKTATGQYNTSEGELQKYAKENPIVSKILSYRETSKLLSTYVDALPRLVNQSTQLIHASFNQAVTSTGRLSSSNPNLQNIPVRTPIGRKIRKAFVSRFGDDGVLLSADYSQIELRVLAHIANDEHLITAFQQGQDIHAATAARVNGVALEEVTKEMRERAKRVNFGIVYGISAFGLSQQIGTSVDEAARFMKNYFALYPSIEAFMKKTIEEGRELGYVKTLWGRKRYIPDLRSDNQNIRNAAERMAINMPIQGTAADIIKAAMVKIYTLLLEHSCQSLLTTQVHDELIFDVRRNELEMLRSLVRTAMETVIELRVPLLVDLAVGQNWGEL